MMTFLLSLYGTVALILFVFCMIGFVISYNEYMETNDDNDRRVSRNAFLVGIFAPLWAVWVVIGGLILVRSLFRMLNIVFKGRKD